MIHSKVIKHKLTNKKEQHRNLFKDYNGGNIYPKKSHFFVEPQMTLSSTNFNKNHSSSLMQINAQGKGHPGMEDHSFAGAAGAGRQN